MRLPKEKKLPRIALIGGETLAGREIQEVLEKCGNPPVTVFGASGEGNFGEDEGEAVYLRAFDEAAVEEADVVVVAGSEAGAEKAYQLAVRGSGGGERRVIDATGFLDEKPEAWIATGLEEAESNGGRGSLFVVAHPAAMAVNLVLSRLGAAAKVVRAVMEVFEPASQFGKRGIHELQQQTSALLGFRQLERKVFDAQLSFNLLAALGEEAPTPLIKTEHRIQSHLATLLNRTVRPMAVPMPSLRLVQAPVFHGYSISCWVEFASAPDVETVGAALASEEIEVRGKDHEMPTNVGVAGQSGVQVGDIRTDANCGRAIWLWAVADNLRMTANAVERLIMGAEKRQ